MVVLRLSVVVPWLLGVKAVRSRDISLVVVRLVRPPDQQVWQVRPACSLSIGESYAEFCSH